MKKNALYMSDLEYWTARVDETDEALNTYRIKMYADVLPLPIEDQYLLRDLLTRQSSYIHYLTTTVAKLQEDDKKSLFRKLFDRG